MIVVEKPGLMTTLQDRGRFGCAMLGVGRAGAMDDVAMRLANALVGNAIDAAALEITLIGPRLLFEKAATIALTGAEFSFRVDGIERPAWQALDLGAGSVVEIGRAARGARGYLAVAGAFAATPVLGSISTDVNARLGGIDGRPLREGDRLARADALPPPRRTAAHAAPSHWSLDPRPWFDADGALPIRVIRGAHFDALDTASQRALFEGDFIVGNDSNRVGSRLDGTKLALSAPLDLVSEPLAIGTLQLPPGGAPIALMAEHPTVGGYPRIGHVAIIDLPRLGQRRPGDRVRFAPIDLDAAQTRYLEREDAIDRLVGAIRERLGR
jgi:antagonist of KipI